MFSINYVLFKAYLTILAAFPRWLNRRVRHTPKRGESFKKKKIFIINRQSLDDISRFIWLCE